MSTSHTPSHLVDWSDLIADSSLPPGTQQGPRRAHVNLSQLQLGAAARRLLMSQLILQTRRQCQTGSQTRSDEGMRSAAP